jgi:hypothetical protein
MRILQRRASAGAAATMDKRLSADTDRRPVSGWLSMPIPTAMTGARVQIDFDQLMRELTFVGFFALAMWTLTGTIGIVSGYLTISPSPTLRFLLAVMVLVFARRTYWEIREWRWRNLPPDERYGFASPLWERPRSFEHAGDTEPQQA